MLCKVQYLYDRMDWIKLQGVEPTEQSRAMQTIHLVLAR